VSTQAREVILVGSMPIKDSHAAHGPDQGNLASDGGTAWDATKVIEMIADHIGGLTPCIPDGDQAGWAPSVIKTLPGNPDIEFVAAVPMRAGSDFHLPLLALKKDADRSKFKLGPYTFAEVAKDSYAKFLALREAGKVPEGTRFQVTLPTPIMGIMIMQEPWDYILPIAEDAMLKELDGILAAIPADDLTIQWDVAHEIAATEYERHPDAAELPYMDAYPPATFEQMIASIARVSDAVPEPVELGIHLCYGCPDGSHMIEPHDGTVLKEYTEALVKKIKRHIDYFHLPVPIARDDDAFWNPLGEMKLDADTKLYLGLIHLEDGVEGAQRRMAAAQRVIPEFGVGTECGFSFVPQEDIEPLLDLHREVATVGN
jgi:methionine synthase II (cobalamin-independent)